MYQEFSSFSFVSITDGCGWGKSAAKAAVVSNISIYIYIISIYIIFRLCP